MTLKFFKIYPALAGQKNKAFTLLETLIAISIFVTSILALLSLLSQSISNTTNAKKKITASYLAQEGIEYMRNLRDTYVLYDASTQVGWGNFNSKINLCTSAPGCYFDDQFIGYGNQSQPMTSLVFSLCSPGCANGALLYDSATGKYGLATGTASGYIRQIKATVISANETKVFSTVYWTQGSGSASMTFSESLYNWVE